MTAPVPVLKNAHVFSTRRTIGGLYHFRPDPVVNRMTRYALAFAAQKHGIQLYAVCALSNHVHIAFHDPHGKHPEFRRDFHSLMTRSVNQHRRASEAKWAPDHKSPVILADHDSILDHTAYIVANAPRHDLVESPEEWPGVVSLVEDLAGPPKIVKKPMGFYDPDGALPEYVLLRFVKPPGLSLSDTEYREEVHLRVRARCKEARKKRAIRGTSVAGRQAILATSPTGTPRSQPARHSLNPRIACKSRLLRIAILRWLKSWRREHRAARLDFEEGNQAVVFPHGTYLHLVRYGVNCSATGPPTPNLFLT